jgi:hypothetical protein
MGSNNGYSNITNLTGDSIALEWKIVSTDFPADWTTISGQVPAVSVCDNSSCYSFSEAWPTGKVHETAKYANGRGDFHLQINLPATAQTGTHALKVKITDQAHPSNAAYTTFLITKSPANVAQLSKNNDDEITLYPNPAYNELNVTFPATIDVRTIGVYNNIGRVVSVFKVVSNSANLNLESLQGGIYFARLMDSAGNLIATRRFTKQ